MKEYERKQLLERIDRDGATVGSRIPERITIDGEPLALRDFVFEVKRSDAVPPEERERVETAKRNLRRERVERRDRIEAGDIAYEEAERLAADVIGIDRALNALEALDDETDLETEAERQAAADTKRWVSFLKRVTGDDPSRARP